MLHIRISSLTHYHGTLLPSWAGGAKKAWYITLRVGKRLKPSNNLLLRIFTSACNGNDN
jgi:hypothetical protein